MRIFKFKGKSIDSSEWIEGYYYKECDNTYIIEDRQKNSILNRNEAVLINPDTVCQFTGLLDKNGKEIYDGDVLRSDNFPYRNKKQDKYYAVVYYCEKAACFGIVMVKNTSSSSWGVLDGDIDGIDREKMKDFEVIGNVHDLEWKQYREYIQEEDEEQHR